MLVLSRKVQESIYIDDNIRIVIVRCGRGHVQIAIEAPRHVHIVRGELVDQGPAATGPTASEAIAAPK